MGLVPQVRASGPGAGIINERLTTWERIDSSGVRTDQIKLTVDTANQTGIPKEGAVISWEEGYDGNFVSKGDFKITDIIQVLFPSSITIVATAASFQVDDSTGSKERRSASFEGVSLADLFRAKVTRHGYSPRVAPEFESVHIDYVEQLDETDGAFLTRLAKERDAVAKPVSGLYVLARRGQVKTITGQDIPKVTISVPHDNNPSSNAGGFVNCRLRSPSKTKVSGVKANWTNDAQGIEHEVCDGKRPFKKLRQDYESEAVALQACRDELSKVKRKGSQVNLELPGDPYLVAEGIIELSDTFPVEVRGSWSIDKVVARGSVSGGYRCSIEATQPL